MIFGKKYMMKQNKWGEFVSNDIIKNTPLIPRYSKEMLENVAVEFLKQYCPKVLERPMAVPIMDIAQNKMGLKVYTKYRLSEDFSVLGQMCFTSGIAEIYDKAEDEFREIEVSEGTMFIDPDTYLLRNKGCFNNTVAHECFHWYKHRNYYLYSTAANNTSAFLCPTETKDEKSYTDWDDIDWIEWQANNAAPRILMPRVTFIDAANEIIDDGHYMYGDGLCDWWVVNKLAELYNVSKQSAEIRMNELGISIY